MNEQEYSKPYRLTQEIVNGSVQRDRIGVYLLGLWTKTETDIGCVGRSDTDLQGRLHDRVGDDGQFRFRYMETVAEAFEEECRLYHEFDPPMNLIHPDSPDGMNLLCPVCQTQFDAGWDEAGDT